MNTKTNLKSVLLVFSFFVLLLASGCKKEDVPVLSTLPVTNITQHSAAAGGYITDQGDEKVISRGIVWGMESGATVEVHDGITINGFGLGIFTSSLSNLNPNTKYYARAYATSYAGTGYGQEVIFTTSNIPSGSKPPTITTSVVSNITLTSAVCGGNVVNAGDDSVIVRGVCWGTTSNPTTSNDKTIDGSGLGLFSSNLINLLSNQSYYVRAYATNSYGTAYGNEVSFTTNSSGIASPSVTTTSISNITASSALCGGHVLADGGAPVTSRGVCWSVNPNPTIASSHSIDGTGIGSFVSTLTGLTQNTTYYVKAYATNSAGTAYGSEVTFKTLGALPYPIQDIDGNLYDTVQIGAQIWLKQNLKTTKYNNGTSVPNLVSNSSWIASSTGARCWYDNDSMFWGTKYGSLYNWYAVDLGNLCPTGWHVPTDNEWGILITYLGGDSLAGGKLKEAGFINWNSPNTGATNSSSFTGLPGGLRTTLNGVFINVGKDGHWWAYSGFSATTALGFHLSDNTAVAYRYDSDKRAGYSIRCLKD